MGAGAVQKDDGVGLFGQQRQPVGGFTTAPLKVSVCCTGVRM